MFLCCPDTFSVSMLLSLLSNAPIGERPGQLFRVTHLFHPLHGREFPLVNYRRAYGEDRAYFYNDDGVLVSLPACWTSILPPDPFVVLSAGRSAFRVADLRQLARLVRELQEGGSA
jgi:hypothetical protein